MAEQLVRAVAGASALEVVDRGRTLRFEAADLLRYHGPVAPGGVAHAFTVLARALPMLSAHEPPERREIQISTAFPGPGARDGIELVTRAVTEGRYLVDPALERPDRGRVLRRYVFRFRYRDNDVTLVLREGFVTEEFIDLSARQPRSADEERHLRDLKQQMADRLLAAPIGEVYEPV